jgi:hypothetical protein
MKRLLLVLIIVLMSCSFAWADAYEAITVAGTAIGTTVATVGNNAWGICRLETAEIRYTVDGATTPTNAIGVVLEPLEWIVLNNPFELKNFRAIRTTGVSGSLKCHYFQR